ncbi:hypothetical protein [Bordetella sp. 15P40C-2]|uniref:hypothetical protein n=1 Tax=Bordetella sp. 15P40C-2 TaxID=2572246 RepID=UPI0013248A25|nr:hypothetical protein [Bordetella sp. 15P40C-2]MVW72167.1 hypothetical protein [Bordetella sp. 15P40C-2]
MKRFLHWLSGHLPGRIISDASTPYLERYYLCTVFGWRFYLHRFVGSDPDRGLHDHPWRFAFSIVLVGWYWELTRAGIRKVRWFNSLLGDSFHRVVLPEDADGTPVPCWTLFAHTAGDIKPWGFIRLSHKNSKVQVWREYEYPTGAKQPQWWLHAPKGRYLLNRAP